MRKELAKETASKRALSTKRRYVIFELAPGGEWTFAQASCWNHSLQGKYGKNKYEYIGVDGNAGTEYQVDIS